MGYSKIQHRYVITLITFHVIINSCPYVLQRRLNKSWDTDDYLPPIILRWYNYLSIYDSDVGLSFLC